MGFDKNTVNTQAPASGYAAVTKSDDTVVNFRALYIGGAGNVVLDSPDGDTNVSFVGLAAGTILPVMCVKVKAATTATNIVGLR
jgi:hypothetical protein